MNKYGSSLFSDFRETSRLRELPNLALVIVQLFSDRSKRIGTLFVMDH